MWELLGALGVEAEAHPHVETRRVHAFAGYRMSAKAHASVRGRARVCLHHVGIRGNALPPGIGGRRVLLSKVQACCYKTKGP